MNDIPHLFKSVYGPVKSWRFGRSLGIDAIGRESTCSFNCVYCQLGDIQQKTTQRRVYVSTEQIKQELDEVSSRFPIDVVTLSGSGEPTLALNLGDILTCVREYAKCPAVVLTNGSLLRDRAVRSALQLADQVVVKLDAISDPQLQRINRVATGVNWTLTLAGLKVFAEEYLGHLAMQTMILKPWSPDMRTRYVRILQDLMPDEVQLNVPTRPRMLTRQLEARENQVVKLETRPGQNLHCVNSAILQEFAHEIETETGIPTKYPFIPQEAATA
ncbi:MAG: radical SAM protein [Cyanobacteria bacterium P01_F01_bin.86]